MEKQPLISVITVVFNGEQFLQQTIDSLRNQTYKNFEYIIIDGGSKDNTIDIIRKNEDIVSKWVSEPDKGLYDAMNKGARMATGELVGTINSDDWYENDALEIVVKAFLKHPNKKIFHADILCVESDGRKYLRKAKTSPFLFKYYGMVKNHPTMFIHKSIYENHHYNIELSGLSDYQFALSIYLKDKTVFYYIPKTLSNFRLGGISGQLSLTKSLKENYIARKNAGMNILQRILGILTRLSIEFVNLLKRNLSKNRKYNND
ncbi:MAG: glycosyltransferase involved in cell wall biosynthesis [Flavobacteriaceae bacterium]|jgi:glycosyltransferase involved in cell wall biosynthesis